MRYISTRHGSQGSPAPLGFEEVMLAVVLIVQHGIGLGEPCLEHRPLGVSLGAGAIGIAAPAEINFGEVGLAVPDPLVDHRLEPGSIGAGL